MSARAAGRPFFLWRRPPRFPRRFFRGPGFPGSAPEEGAPATSGADPGSAGEIASRE
jgi:hypothetical protein